MRAPIPITAWSIVSALGGDVRTTASALREGRSGLTSGPAWFPFPTRCGAVPVDLPAPPAALAGFDCHQARIALATLDGIIGPLEAAIRRWGGSRVAMVLGTSTGGIDRTEQALDHHRATGQLPGDYHMLDQHNFAAFCRLFKQVSGAAGPSYVLSTACSSSAKVFASAARLLDADLADAVLVGGVDSLAKTTLFGFKSLDILADEPCRPFGLDRKGINIGEGGALLLLERSGDAAAHLLGVGESSDAYRMTSPHPEGAGARLAMTRALDEAGLDAAEVDHINAHGTGTQQNDAAEATAIHDLFADRVPVVSTKAFTGHTLGAAGAIEAVFACMSLTHGFIPASLGADPLSPEIRIQINHRARELRCRTVLSNSFGFGGSNCSVLLGAAA
jgi:3-oxoacyl-[acyl-carrier-protein] synthase-1